MIELDRTFIGHVNGGNCFVLAKANGLYMFGTHYDVYSNPWGCPVQDCGTKSEVLKRLSWLAGYEMGVSLMWESMGQEILAEHEKAMSDWREKCVRILEAL